MICTCRRFGREHALSRTIRLAKEGSHGNLASGSPFYLSPVQKGSRFYGYRGAYTGAWNWRKYRHFQPGKLLSAQAVAGRKSGANLRAHLSSEPWSDAAAIFSA